MSSGYNSRRGGHSPQHLRDELVEHVTRPPGQDNSRIPIKKSIGQLWNCSDVVPREWAEELGVLPGSTYAQSVRRMSQTL